MTAFGSKAGASARPSSTAASDEEQPPRVLATPLAEFALFGFLVWAGVQAWIYGGPVAGVLALVLPVLAIAISLREWTRMLREWLYL